MISSTICMYQAVEISVEEALRIRGANNNIAKGTFTCIECGQPVNPHNLGESGNHPARFEHFERNPICKYSHSDSGVNRKDDEYKKRKLSFYWVNLGDSYKEVEEHNFLWAPSSSVDKKGNTIINAGWKHVREVAAGDVIFCHEDGRIIYIAVALSNAYQSPRPKSRKFDKWKKNGYRIDVDLEVLPSPIYTDEFRDELISLYNDKCSPKLFTVRREASQQYMVKLPDGAGALLLNVLGDLSVKIQDKLPNAKSNNTKLEATHRDAIVKARIGQGKFRKEVLKLWGGACPVTKVSRPELLIASHIVSWQLSSDVEKIDKFNGLPLTPDIDKLFDKGFISFSNEGELLIHSCIQPRIIEQLGIDLNLKIEGLRAEHKEYLKRHREIHGISG